MIHHIVLVFQISIVAFFNLIVRLRELKGKQNFSVEHLFVGLYNEKTVKLQLNAAWYFYDFCY